MSEEFCPQHSGLTTEMKNFNDRLTILETKQDEGFKNVIEKLDKMKDVQAATALANAVSFTAEKVENKWKHRISSIAYGFVGAGVLEGVIEGVEKVLKIGGA